MVSLGKEEGISMRRKIMFLFVLILIVTSCSNSKENSVEKKNEDSVDVEVKSDYVEKIDANQPYIYSTNIESGESDDSLSDFLMRLSYVPDLVNNKHLYDVEKITLNFESADTAEVQSKLDDLSANAQSKDRENVMFFFGLFDYAETDETISFIVYDIQWVKNSDVGGEKLKSYVFDKKSGLLMSNDDVLTYASVNEGMIDKALELKKANEPSYNNGEIDYVHKESDCDDGQKYKLCIYILEPNGSFISSENKVSFITETKWLIEEVLAPDAKSYDYIVLD